MSKRINLSEIGNNQEISAMVQEDAKDEQVETKRRKRNQACTRCRAQKLKCQFSNSDRSSCDRCRSMNVDCKFEKKIDEREWKQRTDQRIEQIEKAVLQITDIFSEMKQKMNEEGDVNIFSRRGKDGSVDRSLPPSQSGNRSHLDKSVSNNSKSFEAGVLRSHNKSRNSDNHVGPSKRVRRDRCVINEDVIEDISGLDDKRSYDYVEDYVDGNTVVNGYYHQPQSLQMNFSNSQATIDAIGRVDNLFDEQDILSCFSFFCDRLSKYLPIFIFNYLPPVTPDIRSRSHLLYIVILTVSSLYLPGLQMHFSALKNECEASILSLSPSEMAKEGVNSNILDKRLYDMLACIIASAWLGGDLGFRSCLIASDMAGRLTPPLLDSMEVDEAHKKAVFALSLTTYIIERRLRISYGKPEPFSLNNDKSGNRDYFILRYLKGMFTQEKDKLKSTELKVNANVDICAIMMIIQSEIDRSDEILSGIITEWSNSLEKWLADWIGRLITRLDPSSYKPLILTYYFAKLYLNIQAFTNNKLKKALTVDQRAGFMGQSEALAIDIIEMLLCDRDIKRLITLGPVFYPTIFVTAAALLLKIANDGPHLKYNVNQPHLISIAQNAYDILLQCISLPIFPCYESIQSLGEGIKKASGKFQKHLLQSKYTLHDKILHSEHIEQETGSSRADEPNSDLQIISQSDYLKNYHTNSRQGRVEADLSSMAVSRAREHTFGLKETRALNNKNLKATTTNSLLEQTVDVKSQSNKFSLGKPLISNYLELWEMELIDSSEFFMDALNNELLNSLDEGSLD